MPTPKSPEHPGLPGELLLPGGHLLRGLEQRDAEELHALIEANRPHLARWLPWALGQTPADTERFIANGLRQLRDDDGFQAGIFDPRRLVGVVGFHGVDWQHRSASIGYWLAESAQGRGTMGAAVRAMVDHAFGAWSLNRIEIRASVENERSRALIERLGFRFEGVARQAFRLPDGYHDDAVYAMLADEWPAAPA